MMGKGDKGRLHGAMVCAKVWSGLPSNTTNSPLRQSLIKVGLLRVCFTDHSANYAS